MNANPKNFAEWVSQATAGLGRQTRQRLEVELTAHYEDAYQELVDAGLSPEEANSQALQKLGDAGAAGELFREEYPPEMPWEQEFLPKRLDGSEYGYVKGTKLVPCTREELIEVCKGAGINSTEVTLVWTQEAEHTVPVERIPFLFEAIQEKRIKAARWELLNCGVWGGLLLGTYFRDGDRSNIRHLLLFLGIMTVIPAISGFKKQRAAQALTPDILAKEVAETPGFQFWCGLQKAHLTIALIITCSIVTLMQIGAIAFDGSFEHAALVKPATKTGEWWRLLTSVFQHGGLQHLLFNAIGLGVFGHLVEVAIGRMFLPIIFLFSALSGSLFSLLLYPETSVGASGGIFGLAGFLFTNAAKRRAVPMPGIQQTVTSVALFGAIAGIIAFDLFDSAAHLGGLLAGLAMGWAVKDARRLSASRAFHLAGIGSCAVLASFALLAVVLMMHPVAKFENAKPKNPSSPSTEVSKTSGHSLALPIEKVSSEGRLGSGVVNNASVPAKQFDISYFYPPREPATPAWCINLDPFRNASFKTLWQHPEYTATLHDLPAGLQNFGIPFDVRSLIQLRTSNSEFPQEIRGITLQQRGDRIHFLHGTGGTTPNGTSIGKYIVAYKNGNRSEIPIVYGEHLREWHAVKDSQSAVSDGEIAWSINKCHETRLYHTVWTNPHPDELLATLDFVSNVTNCSPFLVAITLESVHSEILFNGKLIKIAPDPEKPGQNWRREND